MRFEMTGSTGTYDAWIRSIKERVQRARYKALMMANTEQVLLYWDIGHEILEKQDDEGWGTKIVERMSADLKASVLKSVMEELDKIDRTRYAEPELYYSAFRDELAANNYSLVPSRYIEFVDRDMEIVYKTALAEANAKAAELLARQSENEARLNAAFEALEVK